jgi:hypothetical protein
MGVNEHDRLSTLTSSTPTAATHPTVTSGSSPFKDPYLTYMILCLYLLFSSNIAEVLVTWCQAPINHTIQYRPLYYVEAFISNISWSVKNLGMYNSYRAGECFTFILVWFVIIVEDPDVTEVCGSSMGVWCEGG